MSLRSKVPLVAAGLVVGSLVGPPGVAWAAKEVQDVFVTNTPADPVPVAGTVSVDNLPATLAVTGTVEVGNPAGAPVPVREVGSTRRPFQTSLMLCLDPGQPSGDSEVFTVPAGTRVVVQNVAFATRGELYPPSAFLEVAGSHPWPLDASRQDFTPGGTVPAYVINQLVLVHAEPGAEIRGTVAVREVPTRTFCSPFLLSGYQEDA